MILSMSSVGVLLVLIFISSIPAMAVFVWFRLARYPFSLSRLSFALLTGMASFFPALFLQSILSAGNGIFRITNKWGLIAEIFVRIALTEELSRLIMLFLLSFVIRQVSSIRPPDRALTGSQDSGANAAVSAATMASAAGLIAGLGFAVLESAVYGASNPGNALLRTFTAAPLHGACGFRVGSSVAMFRERPVQSIFRFFSAVIIHGVYNFMLIIPGFFPSIAAVLIALSALVSAVMAINDGMRAGKSDDGST